jgi:hypothetical protein
LSDEKLLREKVNKIINDSWKNIVI